VPTGSCPLRLKRRPEAGGRPAHEPSVATAPTRAPARILPLICELRAAPLAGFNQLHWGGRAIRRIFSPARTFWPGAGSGRAVRHVVKFGIEVGNGSKMCGNIVCVPIGSGRGTLAIEIPKTEPGWALRAYLVLIGYAYRGETISDGELAQAIQCGNPHILQRALKHVVRWCTLTNQPHIASLVVESITGMPAPSFSVVPRDLIPTEHEHVWSHDWYAHFPPTIEELAAAT
jgi:hypothetical protein